MSVKFDEFNVFRIPHSRMMQLVNSCNKNLDVTDFANSDALVSLLSNLYNIFNEFKSHEDIENEHIMRKLKSKLKEMAIYNSAVCNCHKDDQFTPLFNLVEMGYMYLNKAKSISEKISFGIKLRKGLAKFTKNFIPHMKEEEEPLLMEHFSQEELSEMKNVVIKLHMQQRKRNLPMDKSSCHSLPQPKIPSIVNESDQKNSCCMNQLPNELILKIFSCLTYSDKFKCAQVCKKWNNIVYDKSNWKVLLFSDWKYTNYSTDDDIDLNENFVYDYKDMEYIDESDEGEFENSPKIYTKDIKTLQFWIKYLLPKIGVHVHKLDLNNCVSLNNNLARRILQLCPNLVTLSLSFTNIGDNAFRGVRLDKLKDLNCEGCENLSDNAFKYLLMSSVLQISKNKSQICIKNPSLECKIAVSNESIENMNHNQLVEPITLNNDDFCKDCSNKNSIEELYLNKNDSNNYQSNLVSVSQSLSDLNSSDQTLNSLKSINLSGCWSISDYGLSYIASKYDLSNLQYVNLSGCINLTSFGMNLFLEFSDLLKGENLYYCDNITDGPLRSTANGCENLECGRKYCCRSGHRMKNLF